MNETVVHQAPSWQEIDTWLFYYLGDDEYKAHYSILLAHSFQRELNNQLASLISYDASRGYADQDR